MARLVSWLGRIRAVWDRSDLTQPSFSRTGHVRLDLSHTTDIIPLSGETTAHHHSTANRGDVGEAITEAKKPKQKHQERGQWVVRLRAKGEEGKHRKSRVGEREAGRQATTTSVQRTRNNQALDTYDDTFMKYKHHATWRHHVIL